MKSREITARVAKMAEPLCGKAGLTLWDVTFEKEGAQQVLTVYIDRDEGVFVEDCEKISRAIDPLLDAPEFDNMPSYTLSVSSAGLGRRLTRLEHFEWAMGKKIELSFYKAKDGQTSAAGTLESRTAEETTISTDGVKTVYQNTDIASARQFFEY